MDESHTMEHEKLMILSRTLAHAGHAINEFMSMPAQLIIHDQ